MQPPLERGPTDGFFRLGIEGKNGKAKMSHGNQRPTTFQ